MMFVMLYITNSLMYHRIYKKHTFVKFVQTLIIFGTKMANSLKLYGVHSFSTSSNSRQRTNVLNAYVPNCRCYTLKIADNSASSLLFDFRQFVHICGRNFTAP